MSSVSCVDGSLRGVPSWYSAALNTPVMTTQIQADGICIALRCWGAACDPPIVLIHGGGAHSRWWDHVAPLLADTFRMVALDLSGHGDSGRRGVYSLRLWAGEVVAVCRHLDRPPVVVGHSMGGFVGLAAAAVAPEAMAGLVTVDSPVRQLPPSELALRAERSTRPAPHYRRQAELLRHFHVAHDPAAPAHVMEHIAATSSRRDHLGWTWKSDPRALADTNLGPAGLAVLRCPYAIMRAEYGLVPDENAAQLRELTGGHAEITTLKGSGHHIPLERPLELADYLRDVGGRWLRSSDESAGGATAVIPVSESGGTR